MALSAGVTFEPIDRFKVIYENVLLKRGKVTSTNTLQEPVYTFYELHRLKYDAQTVNFVDGETVTGATSGATGVVVNDYTDFRTATKGVLTLRRDGDATAYQDNEQLNGSTGGNSMALANGASDHNTRGRIANLQTQPFVYMGNEHNIIPQGLIEVSTHFFYTNKWYGVDAGDTLEDIGGNTYEVLNMKDYDRVKSCLLKLD